MNFLKNHWFGLFSSIIVFFYFLIFVLLLISPRIDAKKRGFIPCTEQMITNIFDCGDGAYLCILKQIIKNSSCDVKVIATGLSDWTAGKQKSPWANYIFTPEVDVIEPDEDLENFYKNNPNVKKQMLELEQMNKELENEPFKPTEVESK